MESPINRGQVWMDSPAWLAWFFLAAGGCDALTGCLLLLAPLETLELLGIAATHEPMLVSFIGIFVGSMGLAYLQPWWSGRWVGTGPRVNLSVLLEITAVARFAVGLFLVFSVSSANLEPAWLSVAATDLTLAFFQTYILRRGDWL